MKKILVPGRNCRGIYPADRSGILIDGRNYYRAFYETARRARRYILMAGWQFERAVRLLRGSDENAAGETRLIPFLNELCSQNPMLEVFILMWDFSPIVGLDKEWFNKWIVDLMTSDRVHFRFDGRHAVGASHHQKLVVIDGTMAFVGGLDISANSWDDRRHWAENAERVLAGEVYEPYHDVQSFVTGPVAWELTKLFEKRWMYAGGQELSLEPPGAAAEFLDIRRLLPVYENKAAISLTRAKTVVPLLESIQDIRSLYCDAIDSAERLVYIENQYFSSQAVYEALRSRLMDRTRPCPQVIMILPRRLHSLVEDISLSTIQAKMLRSLTEIARECDREFGVFYTAAALGDGGPERATYIHSKLLLVDDRFLSVGSANTTNRSMGMDTELNLSWEADSPEDIGPTRSIRRIRANLLMEHTGLRKLSQRRALGSLEGLLAYLTENTDRQGCRLKRHTMESFMQDASWIRGFVPEDISIDPERPVIEEGIYEIMSRDKNSLFAKGISLLNELSMPEFTEQEKEEPLVHTGDEKESKKKRLDQQGRYRWYVLAAIGIGALLIAIWVLS